MAEMSPLGSLILKAMRAGCLGCAGFVVLVFGLEIYKRGQTGFETMTRQDYTFFTVLALILLASLYFYRSISRELAKSGS